MVCVGDVVGVCFDLVLLECKLLLCLDLCMCCIVLGLVVVFGVSNFLLVFFVVGGDIVLVLVVGCLVVVKVYLVYLGMFELVGCVI